MGVFYNRYIMPYVTHSTAPNIGMIFQQVDCVSPTPTPTRIPNILISKQQTHEQLRQWTDDGRGLVGPSFKIVIVVSCKSHEICAVTGIECLNNSASHDHDIHHGSLWHKSWGSSLYQCNKVCYLFCFTQLKCNFYVNRFFPNMNTKHLYEGFRL